MKASLKFGNSNMYSGEFQKTHRFFENIITNSERCGYDLCIFRKKRTDFLKRDLNSETRLLIALNFKKTHRFFENVILNSKKWLLAFYFQFPKKTHWFFENIITNSERCGLRPLYFLKKKRTDFFESSSKFWNKVTADSKF